MHAAQCRRVRLHNVIARASGHCNAFPHAKTHAPNPRNASDDIAKMHAAQCRRVRFRNVIACVSGLCNAMSHAKTSAPNPGNARDDIAKTHAPRCRRVRFHNVIACVSVLVPMGEIKESFEGEQERRLWWQVRRSMCSGPATQGRQKLFPRRQF